MKSQRETLRPQTLIEIKGIRVKTYQSWNIYPQVGPFTGLSRSVLGPPLTAGRADKRYVFANPASMPGLTRFAKGP